MNTEQRRQRRTLAASGHKDTVDREKEHLMRGYDDTAYVLHWPISLGYSDRYQNAMLWER